MFAFFRLFSDFVASYRAAFFRFFVIAALVCVGPFFLAKLAFSQEVLFWSTQAKPVTETQAIREQVLPGFGSPVDYQAGDGGPWLTRLQAELQAGEGSIGVLGALHGDFAAMNPDHLHDLSDLSPDGVKFLALGKLGTDGQHYIPWMQASYVMAAHKQALPYLPKGADIDALTYDQLIAWAANIEKETGEKKFAFPAGPQGLKHRFFQGYLYPSFTDGVVRTFASDKAVEAWEAFKELWAHTHPGSTNFSFLQEQLLSGEAWVVFDHTSRIADAFNQRPDDFIAFPAPAGPTGRGFMPVIAGVAVPVTAPDAAKAKELVAYMLKPETQIATLRATNFFPVVAVDLPSDLPPAVQAAGGAIAKMSGAPTRILAYCPRASGPEAAISTASSSIASSVSSWQGKTSGPSWTNKKKS